MCIVAVLLMGIPLSVVVSPLVWALVFLINDIANRFIPTPDLLRLVAHAGEPGGLALPQPIAAAAGVAALILPGMAAMGLVWLAARALFLRAGVGGVLLTLGAREPRPDDLEEQQLRNLVDEMAIAAGVRPPRLRLLDGESINAAAVGSSIEDATIVVSRRLLDELDRDETQAVIGHLVASVANGDLRIALALLAMFQTFGLMSTILGAPVGRHARSDLRQVLRVALRRGAGREDPAEVEAVSALLSRGPEHDPDLDETSGRETTWSDVIRLPFFMGKSAFDLVRMILVTFFVAPLLALLWRARRYLADATAVQLTRYPDGLARAIARLAFRADVLPGGAWSSHLFIVGPEILGERHQAWLSGLRARAQGAATEGVRAEAAAALRAEVYGQVAATIRGQRSPNAMGHAKDDSFVSFIPPAGRRMRRLQAMGASIDLPAEWHRTTPPIGKIVAALVLGPFAVLLWGVMLGVALAITGICLAIYGLFLTPMLALVHGILR